MTTTASERSMLARTAVLTRWAREPEPKKAIAPARRGFDARFEREVDALGITDPADRARRIKLLRRAYFSNLARQSARGRREAAAERRSKRTTT